METHDQSDPRPIAAADPTPAPRAASRWWHPPEAVWLGRLVFAAAGLATYLVSVLAGVVAFSLIRWGDPDVQVLNVVYDCSGAMPWVLGIVLIAARVRRGKQWRWLSYFGGLLVLPLAAVTLIWCAQQFPWFFR